MALSLFSIYYNNYYCISFFIKNPWFILYWICCFPCWQELVFKGWKSCLVGPFVTLSTETQSIPQKHAGKSIFSENQWDCRNNTEFNVYLVYGVHISLLHENCEKIICKLNFKNQYGKMIYFLITFILWDIKYVLFTETILWWLSNLLKWIFCSIWVLFLLVAPKHTQTNEFLVLYFHLNIYRFYCLAELEMIFFLHFSDFL